jgi:hypothetical protein
MQMLTLKRCAFIPGALMSDLLARLDSMIEALTAPGSSRCSRSTATAQTPTGTTNHLETRAVPVVPAVPAEEQNIIRDTYISRTEEQSRQHTPQGEAPLSLSFKSTGTPGTDQDFCGVERSRYFISNGNTGNSRASLELEIPHAAAPKEEKRAIPVDDLIAMEPPPGRGPVLDLTPVSEAAFNERAAVLEFDAGLTWAEAERQAANEQGFDNPEDLLAAVVAGWAEHLRKLQASERSPRGQQCITSALAFIADGWALEAPRLGWPEAELVGGCPRKPWERLDLIGATYAGGTVVAVTAEAILFHSSGREPLRWLRASRADGARLPWE